MLFFAWTADSEGPRVWLCVVVPAEVVVVFFVMVGNGSCRILLSDFLLFVATFGQCRMPFLWLFRDLAALGTSGKTWRNPCRLILEAH